MIKDITLFLMVALASVNWSIAQTANNKDFLQNEVPKEKVYLHVNSSLLFSGEKLLYKFYCLDSETNTISDLSKIGWVILVNSDKEVVFQHKLNLKEGQAYSDFFVPSNLPSGAYKILGYTAWMQNSADNYFEQEIHILNPYEKEGKGLIIQENSEALEKDIKTETSSDFRLNLNKTSFSNREEVILNIDQSSEIPPYLSISVRRIDDFNKPERIKSRNFNEIYQNVSLNFSDTLIMPEIRGALITGKVTAEDYSKNVIISFPGEESQVNIVSLDDDGKFSFTVNNGLAVDELLIQLTDHKEDDFNIELYQVPQPDFSVLNFNKPVVQSNFKDFILEKIINNQIENAYSANKSDRTKFQKDKGYFFGHELESFNLDDYTRFPDVTQTFVEVIENGRVKSNNDGTHNVLVRNRNTNGEFTLPALLIVDGVVVQDQNKLISFDAERIQAIRLLRSKFFFGPEIYQGVVVVETRDGNFPDEFKEEYIKSSEIITAQNQKKYYSPNYNNEDLKRIPDYRYQLWWNPEASLKNEKNLRFFTSDLDGKFEINVEGFTSDGKPISLSKMFEVK